jgi:hypothetical protein
MAALPPLPARRVRRLRLTATSDEDARSAATLLSDALSTMSLPGADDGRMVVVRQLALGRISLRASAATLALQIEHAARQVWSEAVSYDLPSAAAAQVVVFPDRARPIVALARLHASGASTHHWFWRAAVPEWRPDMPAEEGWHVLLDAAHHLPAAVLVAAAVADAAAEAGVADVLLAGVRRSQAAAWFRMYGWADAAPTAAEIVAPRLRRPAAIDRAVRRWGAHDDRVIWLGALLCTHATPALAADARLPARIARALGEVATFRQQRVLARDQPEPPAPDSSFDPLPPVTTSDAALRDPAPVAFCGERGNDLLEIPTLPDTGGEPTSHAGLLFVVPILERLGFAAFLSAHPAWLDAEFPACLLRAIGERLALPARDPLALALMACRTHNENTPTVPWDAPAADGLALPESVRALLSSPRPRAPISSPLDAWVIAVRRWSRRQARLGLATLVRRPGHVRMSPTHLDISFDLSQTDLRIRRLALDVDPGWVPWLGRVVQFHYAGRDSTG